LFAVYGCRIGLAESRVINKSLASGALLTRASLGNDEILVVLEAEISIDDIADRSGGFIGSLEPTDKCGPDSRRGRGSHLARKLLSDAGQRHALGPLGSGAPLNHEISGVALHEVEVS